MGVLTPRPACLPDEVAKAKRSLTDRTRPTAVVADAGANQQRRSRLLACSPFRWTRRSVTGVVPPAIARNDSRRPHGQYPHSRGPPTRLTGLRNRGVHLTAR
jgi:hypothetical protein